MKKILLGILIGLGLTAGVAYAATSVFNSNQVGSSPSNGKVLQTNGTTSTWVATSTLGFSGGSGTPASPTNSLQFNNAGAFGGSANLLFTGGNAVFLNGTLNATTSIVSSASSTNQTVTTDLWLLNTKNTFLATDINGKVIATTTPSGGGTNYWTTTTNGIYSGTNGYLVGINSSTPTANLTVTGSSTAPTVDLFNITSSTGVSMVKVSANNNIVIANEAAPTFSSGTQKFFTVVGSQAGGVARIVRDIGNNILASTVYGTYDVTAYSASTTISDWPDGTGAAQTFSIATGTMQNVMGDIRAYRDGNDTTGSIGFAPYQNGLATNALIASGNSANSTILIKGSPGAGSILTVTTSTGTTLFQVNSNPNNATVYIQGSAGNTTNIFNVSSSTGTNLLIVRYDGNVGINTSSPAFGKLMVAYDATSTASTTMALHLGTLAGVSPSANGTYLGMNTPSSFIGNLIDLQSSGVSKFTVSGNPTAFGVNIGTSSTASLAALYAQGTTSQGTLTEFNVASSTGTSHFIVLANGNVGVGSTTPVYGFAMNGTVAAPNLTTSAGLQTGVVCVGTGGQLINDSVACLASARRYKTNIQNLPVGLEEVLKFQPVTFNWTKEFNRGFENDPNKNGIQYSLIADDVQVIDPHMATVEIAGKDKGKVHGLADMNHWVALFVQSFKDMENQIVKIMLRQNAQDAKIQILQDKIDKQQAQIDMLLKQK